jgi:hypothetical protein
MMIGWMKMLGLMVLLACIVDSGFAPAAKAAAGDAIKSANFRSGRAEAKFAGCGRQTAGSAVITCMAAAVNTYAADVGSCGFIKVTAPRASGVIYTAAAGMRNATTKEAAVSVLNKATSVLRNLEAESGGETRAVYSRINRALETAIGVINARAL